PLDCRNFASSFAAVTLKSCSIYLQQTFPRILQARYFTTGAIVGFAMDDAVSIVLNGVEARVPAFMLAKGSAACEIVEPGAELARQLGASVRTLHNAVVAIRGMSLQRYTRLRRLWNVRQRLVQGLPTETVKTVALANGFWHMGEFSRLYRDLFGETPQQTLL